MASASSAIQTAASSGVRYFVTESTFGECSFCLNLWSEPKEIAPCRHIYCKDCIESLETCPQCRGPVERLNDPNPVILRMLDRVEGKCSCCSWKGTRKQFVSEHVTCERSCTESQAVSAMRATAPTATNSEASPQRMPNTFDGDNTTSTIDRYAEYFLEETATTATAASTTAPGTALFQSEGGWSSGVPVAMQQPQQAGNTPFDWDALWAPQGPPAGTGAVEPQGCTRPPMPLAAAPAYTYNAPGIGAANSSTLSNPSGGPAHDMLGNASPTHLPHVPAHRVSSTRAAAAVAASFAAMQYSPQVSRERTEKWKQEIGLTAGDYGLSEKDFSFLVDNWTDFATLNEANNKPELRWKDACRMLRYMNLPSHPSDVMSLFQTAMQPTETGRVPFHAVCLWASLNRREPMQWYALNVDQYTKLLAFAQILDVDKTGLFGVEQCKSIGEEYLMRDITNSEWQAILPLIVEKAKELRRDIPPTNRPLGYDPLMPTGHSSLGLSAPLAQGEVKLPLHEIILLFVQFMEQHKKKQVVTQEMLMERQNICQRIAHFLRYYNPSMLSTLPQMLEAFRGEEESLLETLIAEYGPEPR